MRERTTSCDVAVIGAGLSGLLAAAAASRQGARVTLLSGGQPTLELASGCIDLLGADQEGGPVRRPWEALATLLASHPYRLLGVDRVRAGLTAFQQILDEEGLRYVGGGERNQRVATALGRIRSTYLRPASAAAPAPGQPIWVVGLKGLAEFQPEVMADGLRQRLPGSEVTPLWAQLPAEAGGHPVQIARFLESAAGREALLRSLADGRPAGPAPALVLFPAVLSIEKGEEVRGALAEGLGAPVAEVPLLTPSLPGLRLASRLRRFLERAGVEIRQGVEVTGARSTGSSGFRVEALTLQTAGGPVQLKAGAVVLAGGGLLGKGILAEGRHLREPVFGLPVEQPEGWARPALLPAGGHPFVRVGIRTDEDLRPPGYANLFLCGRMLAGYDPYAESSGGGVAIATGYQAGRLAGGASA